MKSEGAGGSSANLDILYDEENPPHPDDRVYAQRHHHWSYPKEDDLSHMEPPPRPRHWRSYNPQRGCWCGEVFGHDWPGKDKGAVHPPQ